MVTERVIYSGRVQGVGFRYTVRSIAKRHPVSGYVKNLPDGTVELVVQGEQQPVHALLAEVAGRFRGNIVRCDCETVPEGEVFEVFDIRF